MKTQPSPRRVQPESGISVDHTSWLSHGRAVGFERIALRLQILDLASEDRLDLLAVVEYERLLVLGEHEQRSFIIGIGYEPEVVATRDRLIEPGLVHCLPELIRYRLPVSCFALILEKWLVLELELLPLWRAQDVDATLVLAHDSRGIVGEAGIGDRMFCGVLLVLVVRHVRAEARRADRCAGGDDGRGRGAQRYRGERDRDDREQD